MFTRLISFAIWTLVFRLIPDVQATCTSSDTPSTQPQLTNNILASGYVNFTVQSCFNSTLNAVCSWKHGSFDEVFYHQFRRCFEPIAIYDEYIIACSEENSIIHTNLTLQAPILIGNNSFTLFCSTGADTMSLNRNTIISVQNCPSSLNGNEIMVNSSSYEYGSQGNFVCPKNYQLFDQNGIYRNNSSTVCNEAAEWKNSKDLQCWTAPVVKLTTNASTNGEIVNVTEGSGIGFNCSYDDVIPSGDESVYNLNGNKTTTSQEKSFVISNINKNDHGKFIFCRAVTNYTEVFKEEGKSETLRLNVLFAPYVKKETVCYWEVSVTQTCVIQFTSNPEVMFVSLTKNGINAVTADSEATMVYKDFQHTFYFTRNMVSSNDTGFYQLNVSSRALSMNFSIVFEIIINTEQEVSTIACSSWIGIVTMLGVLLFLSLIVNVFILLKLRREKEKLAASKVTSIESAQFVVSHPASLPSSLRKINQKLSAANECDYENLKYKVAINEAVTDKNGHIILNPIAPTKQMTAAQSSTEYEEIGREKPSFSGNNDAGYVQPIQHINNQPSTS